MRRASSVVSALFLLMVLVPAAFAAEDGIIGIVKSAAGTATISRGGSTTPLTAGTRLRVGDVLETGGDGSVGVIFRDDAVLSLGPWSRVALDRFECSPAEGRFGFTARILRGTISYLSGLIGRLAPDSARFETPVATVGIRGTHFALRVAG